MVVITSNSEQRLPDAFLRRCVYFDLPFPDRQTLETILEAHLADLRIAGTTLLSDALQLFAMIRDEAVGLAKRPATAELLAWVTALRRAFPEWPIERLPTSHPLMATVYDLDQDTQIPGRRHLYRAADGGIDARLWGPAEWHGIHDDSGRLVVAINYNMDMGDAWEHADDPVYPVPMTSLAYRFAVNYVIYAMTH